MCLCCSKIKLPAKFFLDKPPVFENGDELESVDPDNVAGLFHDFMILMERELNITTQRYRRKDQTWGGYVNGQSDGMVKTIVDGQADIIATSLTQSPNRSRVLNFMWPIGTETYALFVKRITEEEIAWTVFLQPFSYSLWKGLLVHAILAMMFLKVLEWYINRPEDQFLNQGPMEMLLEIFLSFCNIVCTYFGKPLTHSMENYRVFHYRANTPYGYFIDMKGIIFCFKGIIGLLRI